MTPEGECGEAYNARSIFRCIFSAARAYSQEYFRTSYPLFTAPFILSFSRFFFRPLAESITLHFCWPTN